MSNSISLPNLKTNQIAIVHRINQSFHGEMLKTRLQAMGLTKGNTVEVLRQFWWGGPLQVRVGKTTVIAIRRSEADLIMVQLTTNAKAEQIK
jgi:ferrous iron transport protein A